MASLHTFPNYEDEFELADSRRISTILDRSTVHTFSSTERSKPVGGRDSRDTTHVRCRRCPAEDRETPINAAYLVPSMLTPSRSVKQRHSSTCRYLARVLSLWSQGWTRRTSLARGILQTAKLANFYGADGKLSLVTRLDSGRRSAEIFCAFWASHSVGVEVQVRLGRWRVSQQERWCRLFARSDMRHSVCYMADGSSSGAQTTAGARRRT